MKSLGSSLVLQGTITGIDRRDFETGIVRLQTSNFGLKVWLLYWLFSDCRMFEFSWYLLNRQLICFVKQSSPYVGWGLDYKPSALDMLANARNIFRNPEAFSFLIFSYVQTAQTKTAVCWEDVEYQHEWIQRQKAKHSSRVDMSVTSFTVAWHL